MTNMNPESVFEPQRWGLSAENTQSLVHRLHGFWRRFHEGFKTKTRDTSEYAHDYMIGQLRMEEKCNYTNIGCNMGVPAQNMQHFKSNSPWSAQAVIRQVQAEIAATPELQGGVLILDESANAKEGNKSAGAARQYDGRRGKVDMSQVGTLLAYTNGSVWGWVDGELYLPEHWFTPEMAELRKRLGIPPERKFETKIELGWKMIQRTHANGFPFEAICCDDFYGQSREFRARMNGAGHIYMADVPRDTQVYLKRPFVGIPEAQPGRQGRKPSRSRVLSEEKPLEVCDVARREDTNWRRVLVRSTEPCRQVGLANPQSNRSLDFLLLFTQLHEAKRDEIKALIKRKGGMILHMDGTHRSGGRVVFVLQEGHKGIVLDADLIPSEAEEHVKPVLSKFKKTYGSPLVIVRDMAKGLALCASNIFPNSPQQICQVHFIRNLEKDLVTGYHKRLKNAMVKHRLKPRLRALRNAGSGDKDLKKLQQRWVHIAVDYLLYPVEKHVKWISRPISYIIQYYRVRVVSNLVSRLIRWNASNYFVYKPLMELNTCLRAVLNDSEVFRHYRILDKTLEWLDELRDNLWISRKNNLKDSAPGDIDLEEVLKNIRAVLAKICEEGRELGGQYPQIASAINNAF
jgi:SRSO17 transposase